MPFFEVFWYDLIWEMNPRSTNCEADVLSTTPSRRLTINWKIMHGNQIPIRQYKLIVRRN